DLIEGETSSTFDTPPLTSPSTYYYVSYTVEGYSGGICESPRRTVPVSVVPSSSVTGFSVSPGTEFYGEATPQLTLSHGAGVGTVIYESSTDGVTWTGVSTPITVDQSTQFRAKATNGD